MDELLTGVHASIRTAASHGFNGNPQYHRQSSIDFFLHRMRIGLYLPAVKTGSLVSELQKVSPILHKTPQRYPLN